MSGWGEVGSVIEHQRYMMPVDRRRRRKCQCGCEKRATHRGMANGVCLISGCEMYIRRWVRDGVFACTVAAQDSAKF